MAAGEFKVIFDRCSIDDQGCKYLVSSLHKYLGTHSAVTTLLHINMRFNVIRHDGVHHLSRFLKNGCVSYLNLATTNHLSEHDTGTVHTPLGYIC